MKLLGKPLPVIQDTPGGASLRGSHRLSSALQCGRLWWLSQRYSLTLEPRSRLFGTCFHIRAAFRNASLMSAPPAWYEPEMEEPRVVDAAVAGGRPELAEESRECAEVWYAETKGREEDRLEVEAQYLLTLRELGAVPAGHRLADEVISVRPDMIIRLNGRVWLIDYKTQSPRNGALGPLAVSYSVGIQAIMYVAVMRKWYEGLAGMVIERVSSRPPWTSHRSPIDPPKELADPCTWHPMIVRAIEREFELSRGTKLAPDGLLTGACFGRYGECDFLDLCRGEKTPAEFRRKGA